MALRRYLSSQALDSERSTLSGLEALADDSIPQGTTISLGFQDPRRVAKRGAVTQCEPCEAGYRLVVSFIDAGESPAY